MKAFNKITFIGSGNVASHLAKAFYHKDYIIDKVYSKTVENAQLLANQVNATAIDHLDRFDGDSDIYIVSIKDDAISSFLKKFPFKDKLIVHTSGSISITVFKDNGFSNYGIFYPLQTFSKDKDLKISEVPFCIEGVNKETKQQLMNLASLVSSNVYSINSEQRKKIHLAAVFACNFSNYMYSISADILDEHDIDFDILKPLILETAKKIIDNPPKKMQTGPAIRNDDIVMKTQMELLKNQNDYQEIYQLISDQIKNSSVKN